MQSCDKVQLNVRIVIRLQWIVGLCVNQFLDPVNAVQRVSIGRRLIFIIFCTWKLVLGTCTNDSYFVTTRGVDEDGGLQRYICDSSVTSI
jgi:hypothetical protein